jgi:hypothetical protein
MQQIGLLSDDLDDFEIDFASPARDSRHRLIEIFAECSRNPSRAMGTERVVAMRR